MENMLTNLQENGKKVLTAALDFANTTAESLCSVAGQTVKSAAAKGKEFYEDNKTLVLAVAGAVAAVAAVCVVLKLLCGRKKK